MEEEYDFIVLGSGIAGLYFSLQVARRGRVAILTKKDRAESNTNYAQGGIAAVCDPDDSVERHIEDTCAAGVGLCHRQVVEEILTEGPSQIRALIDLGMEFSERPGSTEERRRWDLGREGGHSRRRILHAKDITGRELERTLLQAISDHPAIDIRENHFAIDLVTSRNLGRDGPDRCLGIRVLDTREGRVRSLGARSVILATGGCGKVYLYTTNPDIATGDGVAMAWRAGVEIANMEFIQFHPTCLYHPEARTFLISEAVRGEGGILRNPDGREFMKDCHPSGSLAPRDVVARAIDREMKREGLDHVLLDITHRSAPFLMNRFPNIYRTCMRYGIDMTKEPIPIVPAAHYQCGGIRTDIRGRSSLPGLHAIGEVACTGLHGANRLASNSLLEALVVAHRAARHLEECPPPRPEGPLAPWRTGPPPEPAEGVVISHNWDEIRRLMWDYVGIVRTRRRLERARRRMGTLLVEIREIFPIAPLSTDLLELRNLVTVADLIIQAAATRPESRGLHHILDFPDTDPVWGKRDTLLQRDRPPGWMPIPR